MVDSARDALKNAVENADGKFYKLQMYWSMET